MLGNSHLGHLVGDTTSRNVLAQDDFWGAVIERFGDERGVRLFGAYRLFRAHRLFGMPKQYTLQQDTPKTEVAARMLLLGLVYTV